MLALAGIIILGIFAQWIAWRTRLPAILPLILIGLIVGPLATLWTEDGQKLIEPLYNVEAGKYGLFPGDLLFYFVSLAIGIILFEGGLTLKRTEIKDVGSAITRLLIIGSLCTFFGAGLAAWGLMGLSWEISFLFSSLIIVTGPTVIAPILRNVPLNKNVSAVLKWEGILIDPIGALVAVLVFELIHSGSGGQEFTAHALKEFTKIVAVGFTYGFIAAYLLYYMIKKDWIPHYLLNVFTLALVLLVFVGSHVVAHESGLLTVVVMGMVLGNLNVPNLKEILDFKESLSILLISILFILLSANMDIEQLQKIDMNALLLFAVVVLLIRPLGVFLSTMNSNLTFNEKLFISWVGPRGIVAAGIASLFGIKLTNEGVAGAELITPLVFMIVLGTVLLNATTARFVAKMLGITKGKSDGILIVGGDKANRLIGEYLHGIGRNVVVVDRNERNVNLAKQSGLTAIATDVFSDNLKDSFELLDVGIMFAMTGSVDVNKKVCELYSSDYGENGTYRLLSSEELKSKDKSKVHRAFSYHDGYLSLNKIASDYPEIIEKDIENIEELKSLFNTSISEYTSIPLFIKYKKGVVKTLPNYIEEIEFEEGMKFVYLGKKIELEAS